MDESLGAPKDLSYYSFSFTKDMSVAVLGVTVLSLLSWAFIVRDGEFPKRRPFLFMFETLLVSFVSLLPTIVIAVTRDQQGFDSVLSMLLTAFRFGVLHVALQYSGVYKHIFARSE